MNKGNIQGNYFVNICEQKGEKPVKEIHYYLQQYG